MATLNPFDLLDDDAEDPSQLAAADKPKKSAPVSAMSAKSSAPSKQLPPPQAVREARSRSDAPRGGGRGGGERGFSGGRGGYNRDFRGGDGNSEYSGGYSKPSEEGVVSKPFYEKRSVPGVYGGGGARGGRRGEAGEGERPRRTYERRSGTGRGGDFKREGAGRGNWGTPGEEVLAVETEEVAGAETEKPASDEVTADANTAEAEEQKEPEDKEMTLDEYEKILEEKRKALQSQTAASERKVDTKVFESMQQLSNKKKSNDEIFIKLGSDRDKRKDDKEEKAKKAVSINEFLKPAEGENYYRGGGGRGGGRGRGRGGRDRGGASGGGGYDGHRSEAAAPAIGDTAQFPSLGGK